jgi:hypothetical protein
MSAVLQTLPTHRLIKNNQKAIRIPIDIKEKILYIFHTSRVIVHSHIHSHM